MSTPPAGCKHGKSGQCCGFFSCGLSHRLQGLMLFDVVAMAMNRRFTYKLSACLAAGALLCGMGAAYADTLYKCIDGSGVVLYTNQKTNAKNCTVLSRDLPVTTLGSSRPPAARNASASKPSPTGFPRVDDNQQRSRDTDRRTILEQELVTEQQNLDKAQQALAEGEASRRGDEKSYQNYLSRVQTLRNDVVLHERNIEALKREIGNLK